MDLTNLQSLLTLKEICNLMRMSCEKLRRWRNEGKFPEPLKFSNGGRLLWAKEDIERWIRDNRHYRD